MSIIIQLDHYLDNAIFLWYAKEDPGLPLFSLFEEQTRFGKLFVFALFMYSCCRQLQPAKNEEKETVENASKSPARSLDSSISNFFSK
jgi:hypothetical protein